MAEARKLDPVLGEPDTGHDYDGIRELDNNLPNWWLATLFVTIVFGFAYWMYYHSLDRTPGQLDEYRAELAEAQARAEAFAKTRGAPTDEAFAAIAKDGEKVKDGAAAFTQFCASCHGAQGQGLIGPNLTDAYWLHGNKPTELLKVVGAGVPAKGMPAWEPVLGLVRTENVVAYLLTLKNTNVPGKEPQGEQLASH